MSLIDKVMGPKSKYDPSLPYTYEARIRIFEEGEEYKSYFSDTICGLIEHLHKHHVSPKDVTTIVEVYKEEERPIDAGFFTSPDGRWLFKPEICKAFEQHYAGHISDDTCSFKDRDRGCTGP